MDVDDLSEFDLHEANGCEGLGSCTYCQAEDVLRAEKIKNATRALGVTA